MREPAHHRAETGEEGYLLIALVVACFLLLLALSVAAPRVAKELERDREVESEHRAQEYVRAIQLYYRKNNSYPTSIDQLLGGGTSGVSIGPVAVKYLRQKYKDPITNGDYRLIHLGEAQTEVKGFFGEPLQGVAVGAPIAGTSTPGVSINPTGTGGLPMGATGANTGTSGTQTGATGASGSTAPTSGYGSFTSGNDASTFNGSKGAIVGVGSNGKGHGLVEWNGSEDISAWEFLYDPRVEQLKAKVSLFGGSPAASGSGSLGSGFAPAGGIGASGPSGVTGSTGSTGGITGGTGATGATTF